MKEGQALQKAVLSNGENGKEKLDLYKSLLHRFFSGKQTKEQADNTLKEIKEMQEAFIRNGLF